MTAAQQEQHDLLVRMLEEQLGLDALQPGPPVVYEHVLQVKAESIRIGNGSRIDSFVKLEGGEGLTIGRYVHVASFAHIGVGGGTTVLEDYSAVASHGVVVSGSNLPTGLSMSACAPKEMQRVSRSRTVIGRYAIVFASATVLPGVTLHEGSVLSAGGVATKDIPAWEIWGGVPARFMRKREVQR